MASLIDPGYPYPPEIDEAEEGHLVQVVKDWTIAHGLAIRPPPLLVDSKTDPEGILATSAPVTLFPSSFPRVCFEQAKAVQKPYNELYARISQDEQFLGEVVKAVDDDFIDKLWEVHLKVKEEGYTQPLALGLFRSDYLVHQDPDGVSASPQIKQVEFNTIASSFGGLSLQTSLLHRFLLTTEYPLLKGLPAHTDFNLPENKSTSSLAAGLRVAFTAYGRSDLGHDRCVIFLVQGGERNVFDQRHLEYDLQATTNRVPVFRLPFPEVMKHTKIAETKRRQLLYVPPSCPTKVYEVAVVYLRAGYGPGDYPADSDWQSRYHLERSAAIKCPTVLTQLAGAKKVQQLLATPKTSSPLGLAQFLPEKSEQARLIAQTFTNIYPMDGSEAGLAARELATDAERCKAYVLKPQREGGGNNIYKAAIPPFLRSIPESQWGSYILMELITPPPVNNIILRNGRVERGGVICELGIYGTCLWNHASGEIVHNEEASYLLRTKGDQSEEGGVAAGYGCMDSCSLV